MTIKEEPSTSSDTKFDALLRTMEIMLDKMSISDRQTKPQIKNPNFRGQQQQPQFWIKQREQRAPETQQQQQIRTPLQQNYAQSDEEEEPTVEENLLFTTDGQPIFLTEDEEYVEKIISPSDKDFIVENDHELEVESDDYQRGYLNALSSSKVSTP